MVFNEDTQVQAFLAFLRKDDELFKRLYSTLVGGNEEEEADEVRCVDCVPRATNILY